jgi:hypothetical protein
VEEDTTPATGLSATCAPGPHGINNTQSNATGSFVAGCVQRFREREATREIEATSFLGKLVLATPVEYKEGNFLKEGKFFELVLAAPIEYKERNCSQARQILLPSSQQELVSDLLRAIPFQ